MDAKTAASERLEEILDSVTSVDSSGVRHVRITVTIPQLRRLFLEYGARAIDDSTTLLRGAMRAQDERNQAACQRARVPYFGCNTTEHLADKIEEQDAEVERLTEENKMLKCLTTRAQDAALKALGAENKSEITPNSG